MTINFNCVKINRIFVIPNYEFRIKLAGVAELADALDSDSNGSNTLWVQVPFSAPKRQKFELLGFLAFLCKNFEGLEPERV